MCKTAAVQLMKQKYEFVLRKLANSSLPSSVRCCRSSVNWRSQFRIGCVSLEGAAVRHHATQSRCLAPVHKTSVHTETDAPVNFQSTLAPSWEWQELTAQNCHKYSIHNCLSSCLLPFPGVKTDRMSLSQAYWPEIIAGFVLCVGVRQMHVFVWYHIAFLWDDKKDNCPSTAPFFVQSWNLLYKQLEE